ncbi:MAG: DUF5946 family protein [Vicinamibacterales bacterium]
MTSPIDAYHELSAWTLTLGDETFIHQHVVDAFAAQNADDASKPIGITFALAGLYLHLEHGFSGKQVQRAHMEMARSKRPWPRWPLPADRGAMTAVDVLAATAGPARERAIDAWCESVWAAFHEHQTGIRILLQQYGIV